MVSISPTPQRRLRATLALTVVDLGPLMFVPLSHIRPTSANGVVPALQGRALEIVDERSRSRAALDVMLATKQTNGESHAQTVLLRQT